jgi:hormone-sensitive lipase
MASDETADDVHRRQLSRLFMEVRSLAICNRTYFKNAPGTANERFYGAFSQLLDHLDNGLVLGVNTLLSVAHQFDFDKSQPGNGYRSMITVIQKCCLRIMTLARYVTINRESYLFRANHYSKELEAFVTTLGQLRACLYYLQQLVQYCNEGELFPDENTLSPERYQVAERLLQEIEYLSQESFYGRCLGFQYCESMRRPLTTINVAMACYGEGYQKSNRSLLRLANSVLSCGKYLMNPELRAKQVVNMTRTSDIYFCKSFWSLPENSVMQNVPLYMCPTMAVNKLITIEPVPFELPLADGSGQMVISPPSAHTGVGPVMARLISSEYRSGQEVWFNQYGLRFPSLKTPLQKSPYLIIHCHGGGFVAQSSASHQMYLNFWADDLGIPILSVDYTLAPESPFPRQQEELFFAYCWALQNSHILGMNAYVVW